MTQYVYRFRATDALLDRHRELEGLEIYLASSTDLNDPMEGLQDVFWQGDDILWENLLRHYLLALMMGTMECLLTDEDAFDEPTIAATLTEADLPTEALRELYHGAVDDFLSHLSSVKLPERLADASEPLRIESLRLTLSLVHRFALDAVMHALERAKMLAREWKDLGNPGGLHDLEAWLDALVGGDELMADRAVDWLASEMNQLPDEMTLSGLGSANDGAVPTSVRKREFLFLGFPDRYTQGISSFLIHPAWRVVCFSSDCTNASMWSMYADEHRGAALMFRVEGADDNRQVIPLRGVMGFQGYEPLERRVRMPLHRVSYEARPPKVDFFRFLAMLPRPKIMASWHASRNGQSSPVVQEILDDQEGWRNELLALFHAMSTTKLPDWRHETEVRMVFDDWFGTRREYPKFRYPATSLAGVVFGLRTSAEDKRRIMRVLKDRHNLTDGNDFAFYQMVYSPKSGRLVRKRIRHTGPNG